MESKPGDNGVIHRGPPHHGITAVLWRTFRIFCCRRIPSLASSFALRAVHIKYLPPSAHMCYVVAAPPPRKTTTNATNNNNRSPIRNGKRQSLETAGVSVKFVAGTLRCEGGVTVSLGKGGQLELEGPLCDAYFRVREIVYRQYVIV